MITCLDDPTAAEVKAARDLDRGRADRHLQRAIACVTVDFGDGRLKARRLNRLLFAFIERVGDCVHNRVNHRLGRCQR